MCSANITGEKAPSFSLKGVISGSFKDYSLPDSPGNWTLLLFYPLDFTFVCPTEIIAFSNANDKFKELGVNVYGVSVDSEFTHLAWTETSRNTGGVGHIEFPLLSDLNKEVAAKYGILKDGVALRGLFLIDDEGIVQHATINNLAVGRSVEETLRTIMAFQHAKTTGAVCPADWRPGDDDMKPDVSGLKSYAAKNYS